MKRLVNELIETCKKYDLMSVKFKGFRTFGNWFFGKRVIGINIEPSKEIEALRFELVENLLPFCQLGKFDTKRWKPHVTIAFKDIDRQFGDIKRFVEKKFPEMHNYVLRVTLLKNSRILCEYDFLQRRTLNRHEALSRENKQKTIALLKEKLHK